MRERIHQLRRTVSASTATIAALLAAVALAGAMVGPAVAAVPEAPAQSSDDITVTIDDAEIDGGETATVAVTMDSAPKGVSGFLFNVTTADPSVATVHDVTVNSSFATTETERYGPGTVSARATDVTTNVENTTSPVTLLQVELGGNGDGSTTVSIDAEMFNADGGDAINTTVEDGDVTVTGDAPEGTFEYEAGSGDTPNLPGSSDNSGPTVLPVLLAVLATLGLLVRFRN